MFHEDPRWTASTQQPAIPTRWTREEDKLFEQALVEFSNDLPHRWDRIAGKIPGKSIPDVARHYHDLVHDVMVIDSGEVELPSYTDDSAMGLSRWDSANQISFGSKPKSAEPERKKGTPWTEQEHKLFLQGLKQYGKGDWRSISRNVVITRTPTQVASHAQKYYLRQGSGKKERKRSSIHDVTSVDSISVPVTPEQKCIPPPHVNPPQQMPTFQQLNSQQIHMNMNTNHGGPFGYQNFGFHK
ncbi:GAMYB transcription factor [Parasponia andersonii]|uniref:GAMYB transcription factor n=1 Tax=Parasponia andersonii TaxID=3476 RepID=A0A2P5DAJ4_PARAD|nr:GAMYB transcription factor [Parasponia andersonii]